MRAITFIFALLATAYATPSSEDVATEMTDLNLAPIENPLMRSTVNGEKILPRMSMTAPKDGAKRIVKNYGTYKVSSLMMMSTFILADGPCAGDCYVTAMEATIRYPDGSEANVDTGAWLHHIAMFGKGTGQGSIWAAGNERPTLRLNAVEKYGIDFPSKFMLMIDLMVEGPEVKTLTLEVTYETVPKTGSGYKPATMYWLTIGEPWAKEGKYKFDNMIPTWSGVKGSLLYSIGHMHDGGTDMQLYVGGKMVCKSVMHYNARTGYGGSKNNTMSHTKRQHGGHKDSGLHISDPGACTDFGKVNKGDRLTAEAWYDSNKYPLKVHNGAKENLMGNMRVYIGAEDSGSSNGLLGWLGF